MSAKRSPWLSRKIAISPKTPLNGFTLNTTRCRPWPTHRPRLGRTHPCCFRRHAPVCLENRGCLADYHAGTGVLTLRSATQCPGLLRDALADLLDMSEHCIRVVAADVGGGFGVKSSLYPEGIVLCAGARLLKRPVKWISDRREDLSRHRRRPGMIVDAELGLQADGTISRLRADVTTRYWRVLHLSLDGYGRADPDHQPSVRPVPNVALSGTQLWVATCKAPVGPY